MSLPRALQRRTLRREFVSIAIDIPVNRRRRMRQIIRMDLHARCCQSILPLVIGAGEGRIDSVLQKILIR